MFGKTTLKWQGEEYTVNMTMPLIEEIDQQVNILQVSIDLNKGGVPKVAIIAKLYALLLQSAGAKVTQEIVYRSIMSNPADSKTLVDATTEAVALCFPDIESAERGKKGEG